MFISTYFIEYVFPLGSTSRHNRSKGGDVEVTRAAASKVTGRGTTCWNICFYETCKINYLFYTLCSLQLLKVCGNSNTNESVDFSDVFNVNFHYSS